MYKNLVKDNETVESGPLQAFLNFIKMGEYAFGHPDTARTLLNKSVASAYEAEEDLYPLNLSGDTVFDDNSETSYLCETPESSVATSTSFSISSFNGQTFLPDLISLSPVTSIESFSPVCLDENSNKIKSVSSSNAYSSTNAYSFDDDTIAKVVHDLVFDRYQVTYQRLLQKLRKLNFTEEETKFKNVVDELQNVLKAKSTKNLANMEITENASLTKAKVLNDIKPIYSSTDSKVELEFKPIGVPDGGKLNTSFTRATCGKKSDTQNITECIEDGIKRYLNNNDVKDFCKYLSHLADANTTGPAIPVEAVVYACSVEEITPDCSNISANFTNNTTTTLNNNSLQSSTLSQELSKNESFNSEYNELKFLRTALGDELLKAVSSNEYIVPPTASVGTDDISELLSSTSTVRDSIKRRCKPQMSANTSASPIKPKQKHEAIEAANNKGGLYSTYENITNYEETISANKEKKLIKNRIFVHESIIEQAEKALEYGLRKPRGFVGSPAHLEVERTLLVSKIRRQALINTLYKIRDAPNNALGRVAIENLRCTITSTENSSENYYVCILQYKTTIYSTTISAPNRLGWIDFGGCFVFDNVPNTFNIKIELYAIQFAEINQKCIRVPFLKSTPKLPMMKLMGDTVIGIMNKSEKFTLIPSDGGRFGEHKLTASLHTSIKWPDTLRGFITIGIEKHEQPSIWNRRWCVLDDGKLKYYNYPSDENYCKPIGVLDMQNCKSCDESNRRYLRQKTLSLFFDNGTEVVTYYLSHDSTEEFILWHKNLNMVLRLLREWNLA